MIISQKELLEAAENGTPILNHLDELAEDAMKAIFFERVPICEGSNSTKPLISPSKERVLTNNMGRNEYVIYKGTCDRCGETVEFKLTRTDIVTHSFPLYRGISEFGSRHRKASPLYHESSGLTDFIEHGPYSSHELLVIKEGVKILCGACYNELIGEIEEASRDFLSGDVLEWANDCNNGLIPQEDLWKKEIFTIWKVHKETHKVVELKIDDRYYWLDDDFKKEVNETYGSTYTSERQYWREEDIPKRSSDTDSEFSFTGQNKPLEAGYSTLWFKNSTLSGQIIQLQSDLAKHEKTRKSWLSDFKGIAEDLIDHASPELLERYEARGLSKLVGEDLWNAAKATKEERAAERERLSRSRGRHF